MSECIYHRHHIIPRHAGGTDDPSNIVELTIEEHAEAHRLLYEEHGRWQDKVAWRALSGQIDKDEITAEARREAGKKRRGKSIHSEESRAKIRAAMKERYKDKTENPMYGKTHSEETKAKISASNKGRVKSEEERANISAAMTGKKLSEETKAKLSAFNKGKKRGPRSEETKAKISASRKGKKFSDEHKANLSAAHKGKKRGPRSEETKAKISAARRSQH